MKFISVLGHMEAKLDYNNAVDLIDPNYSLTLRLIFARFNEAPSKTALTKTSLSVELTRPISNVDFKFMIK